MKRAQILIVTLTVIGILTSFNACKKEDETVTPSTTPSSSTTAGSSTSNNNFVFKLNDTLFEFNTTYEVTTRPYFSHFMHISLLEPSGNTRGWIIEFLGDTIGTYKIPAKSLNTPGEAKGQYLVSYSGGGSKIYEATSGEIIVSEIDTVNSVISGTFSFTGTTSSSDTAYITNGAFTKVPKLP